MFALSADNTHVQSGLAFTAHRHEPRRAWHRWRERGLSNNKNTEPKQDQKERINASDESAPAWGCGVSGRLTPTLRLQTHTA